MKYVNIVVWFSVCTFESSLLGKGKSTLRATASIVEFENVPGLKSDVYSGKDGGNLESEVERTP